MDWTLFWTAFGAIGTTLGSLITAIAVVVAVKQYKEPLIKRINITFKSAIPVGMNVDNFLYCISVSNSGIRPITISNIYLNVGSKNLMINNAQFSVYGFIQPLSFPVELQPEKEVNMYLDEQVVAHFFSDAIKNNHFDSETIVKIAVTDTTNGWHYHSTKMTVGSFARLAS